MNVPPELETKVRDAIALNLAARRVVASSHPDDPHAEGMRLSAIEFGQNVRAELSEWTCEEHS